MTWHRIILLTGLCLLASLIRAAPENAVWKVHVNRTWIFDLARSGATLWVGTSGGLEQRDAASGEILAVYSAGHESVPANAVQALLTEADGGLWTGTADGLAYRSAAGTWQNFTGIGLADNRITDLARGADGSMWIATPAGLARYRNGALTETWHSGNSELPDSTVYALLASDNGDLWIGTAAGLARRAAERAIDFMAAYAYHTLFARGYDNDEIYFLSHRPDLDFNADQQADAVIDAPVPLAAFRNGAVPRDLTVADVRAAFAWATAKGRLDEPLVIVFMDHGIANGLLLAPDGREILTTDTLRTWLDNYQTVTGNRVVVILEACHSGTFIPVLAAPQRIIVTSTDDGLAYYDDLGRGSFLKLYLDQLRMGENYRESLDTVQTRIAGYRAPLNRQRPQLEDAVGGTTAHSLCLNGCFGSLPGVLTLEVETAAGTVTPGESVDLRVDSRGGSVRSVWASVITPRIAAQRNEHGYSRLPAPVVNLRAADAGRWEGRFNQFAEQGDYLVSIRARDHQGFVTEARPLVFTVAHGQTLQNPRFEPNTGLLDLPAVTLPQPDGSLALYRAQLQLTDAQNLRLQVLPSSLLPGDEAATFANFSATGGVLYLPRLEIAGDAGTYSLSLYLESATDLRFRVDAGSIEATGP